MIMNSRGKEIQTKQEGDDVDDHSKFSKSTTSTSRQWSGFKNPRIVRVSRSFGGKDRHSKVCTVKGLRDRRIRLSVPTAIQLYDLQDRLGLNQPSKVVDWLLDATKVDIDKLPPLQMPPGNFSQFHQAIALSQHSSSSSLPHHFFNANPSSFLSCKEGIKINDRYIHGNDQTVLDRSKCEREAAAVGKEKWMIGSNEQQNQEGVEGNYAAHQLTAQNFFPTGNIQSSFPSMLNNALPYNPYLHWEASNLSLSQIGSHSNSNIPMQTEDHSQSHNSQLYFCPSSATIPTIVSSILPPYMAPSVESDPRQSNHFQFLSSNSQHFQPNSLMPTLHLNSSPMKSLTLNVTPKNLIHLQENNENQPNKSGNGS